MDIALNLKKLTGFLANYKYAILILLLGVALLLWPSEKQAVPRQSAEPEPEPLEAQLEQMLSQVEGAGQVQVLLTPRTGTEYIYQTDQTKEEQVRGDETVTSSTTTTVTVSSDSGQQPLITQTIYQTYQGALVLSQGADLPAVRLDLVNAVSSLTGLSADKITVIKMMDQQEEIA